MTQVFLTSASTSPWTVPGDFNTSTNTVELLGCGGNGAAGGNGSGASGGGGGSGGHYVALSNGAVSGTVAFKVSAGGSNVFNGTGQTLWEATTAANCYGAIDGANASTTQGGQAGGGTDGAIGTPPVTFTVGTINNVHVGGSSGKNLGGGGGGGSGGPSNGGGGGFTPTTTAGGGGGGANAGNDATSQTGSNGSSGTGGGAGANGTGNSGGGGANGGRNTTGGKGGSGTAEFLPDSTHGCGGGGGGSGADTTNETTTNTGGDGGSYGGAGGGTGMARGTGTHVTGKGQSALIVITYTPASLWFGSLSTTSVERTNAEVKVLSVGPFNLSPPPPPLAAFTDNPDLRPRHAITPDVRVALPVYPVGRPMQPGAFTETVNFTSRRMITPDVRVVLPSYPAGLPLQAGRFIETINVVARVERGLTEVRTTDAGPLSVLTPPAVAVTAVPMPPVVYVAPRNVVAALSTDQRQPFVDAPRSAWPSPDVVRVSPQKVSVASPISPETPFRAFSPTAWNVELNFAKQPVRAVIKFVDEVPLFTLPVFQVDSWVWDRVQRPDVTVPAIRLEDIGVVPLKPFQPASWVWDKVPPPYRVAPPVSLPVNQEAPLNTFRGAAWDTPLLGSRYRGIVDVARPVSVESGLVLFRPTAWDTPLLSSHYKQFVQGTWEPGNEFLFGFVPPPPILWAGWGFNSVRATPQLVTVALPITPERPFIGFQPRAWDVPLHANRNAVRTEAFAPFEPRPSSPIATFRPHVSVTLAHSSNYRQLVTAGYEPGIERPFIPPPTTLFWADWGVGRLVRATPQLVEVFRLSNPDAPLASFRAQSWVFDTLRTTTPRLVEPARPVNIDARLASLRAQAWVLDRVAAITTAVKAAGFIDSPLFQQPIVQLVETIQLLAAARAVRQVDLPTSPLDRLSSFAPRALDHWLHAKTIRQDNPASPDFETLLFRPVTPLLPWFDDTLIIGSNYRQRVTADWWDAGIEARYHFVNIPIVTLLGDDMLLVSALINDMLVELSSEGGDTEVSFTSISGDMLVEISDGGDDTGEPLSSIDEDDLI